MTVLHHNEQARLIEQSAAYLLSGRDDDGEALIKQHWPHVPRQRKARTATDTQKLRVWRRDGFRCRYTGELLFFPPFLVVLSTLWPEAFPYHRHGRADLAHDVYWTHFASLEHVDPVATGGNEEDTNWITTSMARNQVRSRFPIERLGWSVRDCEPLDDWDGGFEKFLAILRQRPELCEEEKNGRYIARWVRIGLQ